MATPRDREIVALLRNGHFYIILSLVPLAFLAYTLANLERPGITIVHPRVLVEAGFAVLLLAIGLLSIFIYKAR